MQSAKKNVIHIWLNKLNKAHILKVTSIQTICINIKVHVLIEMML
jgi:hypothetical protein